MTPGTCECCGARPPAKVCHVNGSPHKVCAECSEQLGRSYTLSDLAAPDPDAQLEVRPAREVVWRDVHHEPPRFTIERDATGRYFINVPDGEQAKGLDRERLWLLVWALLNVLEKA